MWNMSTQGSLSRFVIEQIVHGFKIYAGIKQLIVQLTLQRLINDIA